MNILAFTDNHGHDKSFESVKKKAAKADLIVCCGDFTRFGKDIEKKLLEFNKIGKPVILIPGNHEENEPLDAICEELENVFDADKGVVHTDDVTIFGFGGGGFSREDKNLEKMIKDVKKNLIDKPLIMMTHAPPYRTKLDKLPMYGYVGNKSINIAVKELKPKILLCGHLHEHFHQKDKLYNTILINPGPDGTLITLNVEKNNEKNKNKIKK